MSVPRVPPLVISCVPTLWGDMSAGVGKALNTWVNMMAAKVSKFCHSVDTLSLIHI